MTQDSHPGQLAGKKWSPGQYLKFADSRFRPALELLSRIDLKYPEQMYDLGCGSGEVTSMIAERWPHASIVGVDSSPEMLARAAQLSTDVTWVEADIREWAPADAPHLIYANASLQWIEDHESLLPRLVGYLRPGGVLAVQMPQSWHAPSHQLMRETLANGGSDGGPIGPRSLRDGLSRPWVAEATDYYDLLKPAADSIDIWETEYLQELTGVDPVLEWVRGTGLRPILNGLDDEEREHFLDVYTHRLREAYPVREDGVTLYPFRRLFVIVAVEADHEEVAD